MIAFFTTRPTIMMYPSMVNESKWTPVTFTRTFAPIIESGTLKIIAKGRMNDWNCMTSRRYTTTTAKGKTKLIACISVLR